MKKLKMFTVACILLLFAFAPIMLVGCGDDESGQQTVPQQSNYQKSLNLLTTAYQNAITKKYYELSVDILETPGLNYNVKTTNDGDKIKIQYTGSSSQKYFEFTDFGSLFQKQEFVSSSKTFSTTPVTKNEFYVNVEDSYYSNIDFYRIYETQKNFIDQKISQTENLDLKQLMDISELSLRTENGINKISYEWKYITDLTAESNLTQTKINYTIFIKNGYVTTLIENKQEISINENYELTSRIIRQSNKRIEYRFSEEELIDFDTTGYTPR